MIKCQCKHQSCGVEAQVNIEDGELWLGGFNTGISGEIVLSEASALVLIGDLADCIGAKSGMDTGDVLREIVKVLE